MGELWNGGQLLRTSTVLSALLQQPIQIDNVRGNRKGKNGSKGGLKAQHIACVETLARWSGALTEHVERDSKTVKFEPSKGINGTTHKYWDEREVLGQLHPRRECSIEIVGVGSILLLLQAVIPYVFYRGPQEGEPQTPLHLTAKGGTHVSSSLTLDYFQQVVVPTLTKLGYPEIEVKLKARGWHIGPTNPGEVEFIIPSIPPGRKIPGFFIEDRGTIERYTVTFIVPQEAKRSFRETISRWSEERSADVPMEIISEEESGHIARFYLLMVAHSSNGYRLARDWLYDRKARDPHKVSQEMVRRVWGDLQNELAMGSAIDHYLQDQLIVYQILADGSSSIDGADWKDGSLHAQTVRWIGEALAGIRWESVEQGDVPRCQGVGLASSSLVD